MKHIKNITLLLFIAALLQVHTGCKKGWLDVNYNPRDLTVTNATPDVILPGILEKAVASEDLCWLNAWMGYWSHWNIPVSDPLVNYNRVGVQTGGLFVKISDPFPEIAFLENKARETGQLYYIGISKVVKAIQWSQAVDLINNMPYSEAFNASILRPKYDDGKFIYEDLMKQLDSAVFYIKSATPFQSNLISLSDIMFHGDKTKWVRFINTLKLRLLVHQANRPDRQTYISNEIQKITTEGSGFLGTGEDAAVNPGYNEQYPNRVSPYFGNFSSHNFQYGGGFQDAITGITSQQFAHANYYAMELLKGNHDPRLGFFYSTADLPVPPGSQEPYPQTGSQEYRGNKFGFYNNASDFPYQDGSYVSAIGGSRNTGLVDPTSSGLIKGRNMSIWAMTSVESMFLQAEAIQRGWIPGDVEQTYKNAIKESFRWLNAGGNSNDPSTSDAVFDNWYDTEVAANNIHVSWGSAPDKYKLIMFQKYMALNGIQPLETYTDYRRNGRYPDIPLSQAPGLTNNSIPIRLLYKADEYILNTDNVNAQGTIDIFTSKIWWMP